MKVIINRCHGGFGLSSDACEWLIKEKGWTVTDYSTDGRGYKDPGAKLVNASSEFKFSDKYHLVDRDDSIRTDPDVLECLAKLGKKASGRYAALGVVEVPDNVDWEIGEYDGAEWVQEVHRRWE